MEHVPYVLRTVVSVFPICYQAIRYWTEHVHVVRVFSICYKLQNTKSVYVFKCCNGVSCVLQVKLVFSVFIKPWRTERSMFRLCYQSLRAWKKYVPCYERVPCVLPSYQARTEHVPYMLQSVVFQKLVRERERERE